MWCVGLTEGDALWRQRERLVGLGVKDVGKAQEFGRSTGKQDRDEAAKAYRAMLDAWEAKLEAWQALLEAGPQALSHKQRIALAADHAKAFLTKHEEEPFDAPPPPSLPELPEADNAAWQAAVGRMAPDERKALVADLREFLKASEERRTKLAFRLLEKHPILGALVGRDLAAGLDVLHGADTDEALAARGLHVDAVTRRLVSLEMVSFMGAAERGLDARRGGEYEDVRELEAAPAFVAPAPAPVPSGGLSLEGLLDHKAKTTSIRPKTVSDNRAYLRKFIAFLGHDDARRVTKDDVRRWRDSLSETSLSPKTIEDKYLSAVRAVLSHGVKEFDLPFNAASGIADNRPRKAPERSPGWTELEAVQILKATFGGSSWSCP